MKPTLLILAAGMGSRFGGLKQVTPVGPSGETIIEYSIYDAIRAGFGKVVFVIREGFASHFIERFEPMLGGKIQTEYVYQELEYIPSGFIIPDGREKPWGTGHAILMAKNAINEPFAAINADDFYGENAFKAMADFLVSKQSSGYSMVGYRLKNTLSEFGSVSRGVCEVGPDQALKHIVERTNIRINEGKIVMDVDGTEVSLTGDEIVSMNFWGFQPGFFGFLEKSFTCFLEKSGNGLKTEFYIPSVVFEMIIEQGVKVEVLRADSPWFGVTYKEDHPLVVEKLRQLVAQGIYPVNLWDRQR
jgi:NDP-sugar pyrophosphorylase family protein